MQQNSSQKQEQCSKTAHRNRNNVTNSSQKQEQYRNVFTEKEQCSQLLTEIGTMQQNSSEKQEQCSKTAHRNRYNVANCSQKLGCSTTQVVTMIRTKQPGYYPNSNNVAQRLMADPVCIPSSLSGVDVCSKKKYCVMWLMLLGSDNPVLPSLIQSLQREG